MKRTWKKQAKYKYVGLVCCHLWLHFIDPFLIRFWSVVGRFSSPLKTGVIPCCHDKMGTESPAEPQENPYAKVGIIERVEYTQWYTWKCPYSEAYQIIIKTYICIVVERPSILYFQHYFLPPLFHLFHPLHHSVEPLQPFKTVSMVFSFWCETIINDPRRIKKRH